MSSFTPTTAIQFQVTVPTLDAAQHIAEDLVARGHVLITARQVDHYTKVPSSHWYNKPPMRPHLAGQWDVFSLVAGPQPDNNTSWWSAMEAQAVKKLAHKYANTDYGMAYLPSADQALRTFNRDGLLYELDEETASARRLVALRALPARSAPEPVDPDPAEWVNTTEDLPSGPGEGITLGDVDSAVDWSALSHAYGPATDVPGMLRGLAANDEHWEKVELDLISSVLHQGTIYDATAPTMSFVACIALSPNLSAGRRLGLLDNLFAAGSQYAVLESSGYEAGDVELEVRDTVIEEVPRLLELWPVVTGGEQRLLLLLAALAGLDVPEKIKLRDPASRLAQGLIEDIMVAQELLATLARSNEELLDLVEDTGPLKSRLIEAIHRVMY